MKKACVVCGFEHYVEKHHPDGKHTIITFSRKVDKNADVETFSLTSDEVSGGFLQKKKEEGFSTYFDKKHINPDDWIYLCGNCHNLVHRKSLSIDEIRSLYDTESDVQMEIFDIMRIIIGDAKFLEIQMGIRERWLRKEFFKQYIGVSCPVCSKKHREGWIISSCFKKIESEDMYMDFLKDKLTEWEKQNKGRKSNGK